MLRPPRDSARAFSANLLLDIARSRASVDVLRIGRFGNGSAEMGVRGDELGFTRVPGVENFCAGCAAEDTRVDKACEADAGDVAAGAEDAFEVPDSFCAEGLSA